MTFITVVRNNTFPSGSVEVELTGLFTGNLTGNVLGATIVESSTGQFDTIEAMTDDGTITISDDICIAAANSLAVDTITDKSGSGLTFNSNICVNASNFIQTDNIEAKGTVITVHDPILMNTAGDQIRFTDGIEIGDSGTNAINGTDVAVGKAADAEGGNSVAIGQSAQAIGAESIAIGLDTSSTAANVIAIGNGPSSVVADSIVLGSDSPTGTPLAEAWGQTFQNKAWADGNIGFAKISATGDIIKDNDLDIPGNLDMNCNHISNVESIEFNTMSAKAGTIAAANTIVMATSKQLNFTSGVVIGDAETSATNGTDVAVGKEADATGGNSAAFGQGAQATAASTIAIGENAAASLGNAIAIGTDTVGATPASVVIGGGASSTGTAYGGTVAIGALATTDSGVFQPATSTSFATVAIGSGSLVTGSFSVAIGNASVSDSSAVGIGRGVTVTGTAGIAMGLNADTSTNGGIAFGRNAEASGGTYAIAIGGGSASGSGADATAADTIALGRATTADTIAAIAIGEGATANATAVIAMGRDAVASDLYSVAIGGGSGAGTGAQASGDRSVALGYNSEASGDTSFAVGRNATASSEGAIAIGKNAEAITGDWAVCIGGSDLSINNPSASGSYSVALGSGGGFGVNGPVASASDAISVGRESDATASAAIAIGRGSQATAANVISIGYGPSSAVADSIVLGSDSPMGSPLAEAWGQTFQNKAWDDTNFEPAFINETGDIVKGTTGLSGNVNWNCANISNVQALYVDQMFGKNSPINVEDTLIIADNGSDTATIEFESGIRIGTQSTTGATNATDTAVGKAADATGGNAVALGQGAQATGASAVAIGLTAAASTTGSIAIGDVAVASTGVGAVAIGDAAGATNTGTVAIGDTAAASVADAIAIGRASVADAADAVALGQGANAGGASAIAIGLTADASTAGSIAIGDVAIASTGVGAIAIGDAAEASATGAITVGDAAVANVADAIAIGRSAVADAADAVAIGQGADAGGVQSIAIGEASASAGDGAVAIGDAATASAAGAIAMGDGATSAFTNAVAIGDTATATAAHNFQLGEAANSMTNAALNFRSQTVIDESFIDSVSYLVSNDGLGNMVKGGDAAVEGVLTVGGNAIIQGNLSVLGNIATIDTETITIEDNKVVLNSGETGAGVTLGSAGFEIDRGTEDNFNVCWDETRDALVSGLDDGIGDVTANLDVVAHQVDSVNSNSIAYFNDDGLLETEAAFAYDPDTDTLSVPTVCATTAVETDTLSDKVAGFITVTDPLVMSSAGDQIRFTDGVEIGDSDTDAANATDVAIGKAADATGGNGVAVGQGAQSTGARAIATGYNSESSATAAIGIGDAVLANAASTIAIGDAAQAVASDAIAIGSAADASITDAIAIGRASVADAADAVALGQGADAGGASAVAIGLTASASTTGSIAIGDVAVASTGVGAVAIGDAAGATNTGAIAIGDTAAASVADAIAIGRATVADGANAVAIGQSADAGGVQAVAIGEGTNANAACTVAIGGGAAATAANVIAIGCGTSSGTADTITFGSATPTGSPTARAWGQIFSNHVWSTDGEGLTPASIDAGGNIIRGNAEATTSNLICATIAVQTPLLEGKNAGTIILGDDVTMDTSNTLTVTTFAVDEINATSGNTISFNNQTTTFDADVSVCGTLSADTINEKSTGVGVTVDGVLMMDNDITADDVNANTVCADVDVQTDTLTAKTGGNLITVTSGMTVNGPFTACDTKYCYEEITANAHAILETDDILGGNTLANAIVFTLPAISSLSGGLKKIIITDAGGNASGNNVTIVTSGTDTMFGGNSFVLSGDYNAVQIISDGVSQWLFV